MLKEFRAKGNAAGRKVMTKMGQFKEDERGELSQLAWVIGSAVVVVLIIAAAMIFAPDTAETMWNAFVSYARRVFGI